MIVSSAYTGLLIFIALSAGNRSDREELYNAIKNGDQQAFKSFFDKHYDALFVFLRNRNVSRDVAEDLIQKAFIYIWENRHTIEPNLSLKSYLFRIAYTRMINHMEQQKRFSDVDDPLSNESDTHSPQEMAEFNDLYKAFQNTVSNMPEKRRMVFESCFLQDLTYKETAEILSVSVKTVENHMALAFKDLRKALNVYKKN